MEYDKPHLSYEQQLHLMLSRGLKCADHDAAIQALQTIGYYRLSAYTYPFRRLLPEGAQRDTSVQYRSPDFDDGHSVEEAIRLYEFDKKLRLVFLEGLEALEVGLRVQVSYVLGLRDRFGYARRESLHQQRCSRLRDDREVHDIWLERHEKQVKDASSEDFMTHYQEKYGGQIPIWVATEVMDFGQLNRLFKMMDNRDRNQIARHFGVKTGRTVDSYLLSLSHLRNTCAHHSRAWNRRFTYAMPDVEPAEVGEDLHHLVALAGDQGQVSRKKLYVRAATLAYMLRAARPGSQWPSTFKTHMRKFPSIAGLSPTADMGFPEDWEQLELWSR